MMKFLNINATINVKPQFDGEVLKAGTPLDISGAIANSDAAVGLVANDTAKGAESIAIVTEGSIDLTEVAASYGSALTDDCIAALKGITFLYGGKAVVPSGLPSVSASDNGKVLTVESGAWSAQQPSGGAPCVVLDMDSSGNVSCSHTSSQLAAICRQYGAGDAMGGTACAVPAVVTGYYNAAGSLRLYVGDWQSSLSSASLRTIAYVGVEFVTVISIECDYGYWSGFYINIPLVDQQAEMEQG